MRVEEEYVDVLQNIEFAVVSTYRKHPELVDHDVERVLEAAMDCYKAEKIGRAPREVSLSPAESKLLDAVRGMCEWRLGRSSGPAFPDAPAPAPKTVDEILLCLKRLIKSIKSWNRHGGERGYLDFIIQYVR
jgi:hypothetical protein